MCLAMKFWFCDLRSWSYGLDLGNLVDAHCAPDLDASVASLCMPTGHEMQMCMDMEFRSCVLRTWSYEIDIENLADRPVS